MNDVVSHKCTATFGASCNDGSLHKFQCNPPDGVAALPWCQQREPGVGNGWDQAWVDQGKCQ
jgi:hypothetical protein